MKLAHFGEGYRWNPKTSSAGSISSKCCRTRIRLARYAPVMPVARIAKSEQMVRKVPVCANARQSVCAARVVGGPAVVGLDAGDIRIQRRQLVHQLTGALDDRLVAQPRRRRVAVGAARRAVDPPRSSARRAAERPSRAATVARGRAAWRIFAGTGSVCARYAVRNQKWRASDLKSVVGIPVATTTRFASDAAAGGEHFDVSCD